MIQTPLVLAPSVPKLLIQETPTQAYPSQGLPKLASLAPLTLNENDGKQSGKYAK